MHARGHVLLVSPVTPPPMRHQPVRLVEQGQGGIFKGLVQSVVQDGCVACSSSECGLLLAG
jgi:hypothetical protein